MEEDSIKESIKDKEGVELFRELCRHMNTACVEDYYKNGLWQNDLLKLDIEIVDAHRQEAGAPDIVPLSEISYPDVPAAPKAVFPNAANISMMNNVNALRQASVPGGSYVRPMMGVPQVRPAQVVPGIRPMGDGVGAVGTQPGVVQGLMMDGTAAADLRQIALFVSKWRLEPHKTKIQLAKLTPARRRYIMQSFKFVPADGTTSMGKLEEYIEECEKSGWASVTTAASTTASTAAAPAAVPKDGGVKRELDASATVANDEKKPKTAGAEPAAPTTEAAAGAPAVPPSGQVVPPPAAKAVPAA